MQTEITSTVTQTEALAAEHSTDLEQGSELVEQHAVLKTILLHLVPGVIIYGLFLLLVPVCEAWGYPGLMGLVIAAALVLLPTLGEMYSMGKKRNRRFSLEGIVLYRQKMPWWQYVLFTLGAVVYAFVITIAVVPLFQGYIMAFFTWWPGYNARLILGNYPASHILIAEICYIALNGLLPVIEELYFRGWLMPRIARFGAWTPWISLGLFSLYHLWQPWNNVLNIIALWPLTFLSWKKRNVYLGIAIHCTLNIVGMLPLIIGLFVK